MHSPHKPAVREVENPGAVPSTDAATASMVFNPGKIQAVIFDMDGVLIDAKDWHYEALNKALGLFGYAISRHDHLVTYDGLPTRKKLEMLTLERGLPAGLHAFLNELKQVYTAELVSLHCKPLFAHEYALTRLKAAGLRLAVASNSVRSTVDSMLSKARLLHYFDTTLSNEDIEKAKPDPEIYLKAMNRLSVTPDACVVVEDNQNGVVAAQRAGAHVLMVDSVHDVTFNAIASEIARIEEKRQ